MLLNCYVLHSRNHDFKQYPDEQVACMFLEDIDNYNNILNNGELFSQLVQRKLQSIHQLCDCQNHQQSLILIYKKLIRMIGKIPNSMSISSFINAHQKNKIIRILLINEMYNNNNKKNNNFCFIRYYCNVIDIINKIAKFDGLEIYTILSVEETQLIEMLKINHGIIKKNPKENSIEWDLFERYFNEELNKYKKKA